MSGSSLCTGRREMKQIPIFLSDRKEETLQKCQTVPLMITVLCLLLFSSLQSAAVRRIRRTRPAARSPLDSGWDSWTNRLLWTAGCFCGGGRPAGRGGVWAAGWGGCTGTVYQHPAEERKQLEKQTPTGVRLCPCEEEKKILRTLRLKIP